jgi:hypothetical protein
MTTVAVPLPVTRADLIAIDLEMGFPGIGERMVKAGYWKLQDDAT